MPPDPPPPAGWPAPEPVPPELLAWARQTFDMQELLDDIREVEETGGVPLEAFIAELEAIARGA